MEIYCDTDLPSNVKRSLAHKSEMDVDEGEWEESEYNYRLNLCDTVFFAVKDGEVVGHLGLMEETIKCVYVDSAHHGEGIAYALYAEAFRIFPVVNSDDAREPAADHIWEQLMEKHPENITYNKVKDQYTYQSDEWINR